MDKNVLIIFAKYPVPGLVKTRLAKDIGDILASMVYRCFVQTVVARTHSNQYATIVFFTPAEKQVEIQQWLGAEQEYVLQQGDSLGKKLADAFENVFKQGAEKAVVIGTDSPLLDDLNIEKAFNALDTADCVIGPAQDGGYYLLGMKKLYLEIFDLDEFSTDKVYANTKAKIDGLDLSIEILETHFDVDTKQDLFELWRRLGEEPYIKDPSLEGLREKVKEMQKNLDK